MVWCILGAMVTVGVYLIGYHNGEEAEKKRESKSWGDRKNDSKKE